MITLRAETRSELDKEIIRFEKHVAELNEIGGDWLISPPLIYKTGGMWKADMLQVSLGSIEGKVSTSSGWNLKVLRRKINEKV